MLVNVIELIFRAIVLLEINIECLWLLLHFHLVLRFGMRLPELYLLLLAQYLNALPDLIFSKLCDFLDLSHDTRRVTPRRLSENLWMVTSKDILPWQLGHLPRAIAISIYSKRKSQLFEINSDDGILIDCGSILVDLH